MTGSCYLKALVLDEDCVYQKTIGEEEPWYARKVTAERKFITEVEVSVGYQSDGLVCVSGINEGDYFDANLHVTNDSYVTIVGKSGSGKSTLLNILGLVERYDGGAYIFNGVKIHNSTLQLFDK